MERCKEVSFYAVNRHRFLVTKLNIEKYLECSHVGGRGSHLACFKGTSECRLTRRRSEDYLPVVVLATI